MNYRHEIQGLKPPKKRNYKDFDAGSKVTNRISIMSWNTLYSSYYNHCWRAGAWIRAFLEGAGAEAAKEIYKNGSKEPGSEPF